MTEWNESKQLYERAKLSEAGGIGGNSRSPLSGFKPHPIFIERGTGPYVEDIDGNQYVDYLAAFGPLVLGHRPPAVIDAVTRAIQNTGSMFGMGHRLEVEAAESVVDAVPCWELVRFANTGTEAVIAALRMARAHTGRTKILRFEGHYHGWADQIHFSHKPATELAGDEDRPTPVAGTAGMPEVYGETLIVRQWNDPEILKNTFAEFGEELAAVICEPIMGNCTVIPPAPGYLELLRELSTRSGTLLIFDETKSGFRVALGGAQELYGVIPDISTAAKGIGGGFPLAAVGTSRELFEPVIDGRVLFSGTYHTNPVGMAACVATMKELRKPGLFAQMTDLGNELQMGLTDAAAEAGVDAFARGIGPMFQIVFAKQESHNYRSVVRSITNPRAYSIFWESMIDDGILFNPQPLECWFVSAAHGTREVDRTISAARFAFEKVASALVTS